MKIRPIAIYLPQFHPIPENDNAWGEGFTEWNNVRKAKPLFKGHYQPNVPLESIGYYDLRDPDVLVRQAAMAKKHGIYGFAFYHYWFNGKRLLETPLDNMIKYGKPDFPFCCIWANENWTKKWDGGNNQIIISQNHSPEDDLEHIRFLCQHFLKNENYIKINGRPLFIVYKPLLLPNPTETAQIWRSEAEKYGINLYLCHMVFGYSRNKNLPVKGYDAVIDFEPFSIRRRNIFDQISNNRKNSLKLYEKSIIQLLKWLNINKKFFPVQYNKIDYKWIVENLETLKNYPVRIYPSIVPGWDNTARRNNDPALILTNSNPQLFENLLRKILKDFTPFSVEENFIFINAWNEWAEGNHIEPCKRYGTEYLETIERAIKKIN